MTVPYLPRDPSDVARLVTAYPLCWIVSGGRDDRLATALPLLVEADANGRVESLLGHIPLANPHYSALQAEPRASVLCIGPQGYISPKLVSNPVWGPTWNYAACRFEVDVELVPEETDAALSQLAKALEGGAPGAWTPDRMGPRYEQLKQRIIAFRGHVRETHPRFKLGQDEADGTFAEIVEGLGDRDLADWMLQMRGSVRP
jgi:transcriptional regulator